MKSIAKFLKAVLVGGLLVVLPVWISILLLLKAIGAAIGMLRPIAELMPQTTIHPNLLALILLIALCFFVGLVILTKPGRIGRDWLMKNLFERMPGFAILRSMSQQLTGDVSAQSFQPALVEIEDALVPAFVVETHADGQCTVFVSSSPTPMAGAIYILPGERVHLVDVPLHKAMVCISKWGTGAEAMRAAMRSQAG